MQVDAYAMDRDDTARTVDTNGWFEVRDNPISKVGVFQYLGKSIPGAPDPAKIYNVYRSADELGSPETLASLRLQPWIDDHVMLGPKDKGFTPAEDKTVHGVIGEQVYFDVDTLYANLKMFSEAMAQSIASGKKELSLGYRCKYVYQPGVYDGQPYDYVQVNIRCNHIASVDEGRMGPDVSVLDHFTFTFDEKDITTMPDPTDDTKTPAADPADPGAAGDMSITDALAAVNLLLPVLQKLAAAAAAAAVDPAATVVDPDPHPADAAPVVATGDADPAAKPDDKKEAAAMDAKIKRLVAQQVATAMDSMPLAISTAIGNRDKLAASLVPYVGTFDHSDMSTSQVAAYGIKKLNIKADKGTEAATLAGYLQAVKPPAAQPFAGLSFSMDASDASGTGGDNFVNKFVKGAA